MTAIASVFAFTAGAGFILIGTAALIAPAILSHLYGAYVHERRGHAFVRATGARDIAFGILVLAFAAQSQPAALFWTLATGVLIAAADFVVVWSVNRRWENELAGHAAGFVFLAVAATFVGIGGLTR